MVITGTLYGITGTLYGDNW